jgi:putative hydrolase
MFDPAKMGQLRPEDIGAAFQKIGQLLSWDGGPVNWDLARDLARQTAAAAGPDRSVSGAERAEVAEAVRLAELWLDPATTLAVGTSSTSAWSRAEWVEGTLPVWKQLVEPVAARVVSAMQETLTAQAPPEMAAMAGPVVGMMRSMGGAMFGAQVGQALGSLAGEVVGATDVGLPLGPDGRAVLLPANVTAFGEGLGVPADQVRLYLALRESAHQRLFGHVPWLRSHLFSLVESYASGIAVDTSALEDAIGRLDPTNPEALQEALSGGLFAPQVTPQQQVALERLETALALVEGWVDTVVHEAASGTLPAADALRETVRRRRAAGGPAEQTFASLVGLELRPRRLREAAALWTALGEARGIEGRDAVWAHPDLMPGAEDLDDPQGFLQRRALDDLEMSELDTAPDAEVPHEPDEPGDAGDLDEPGAGPPRG